MRKHHNDHFYQSADALTLFYRTYGERNDRLPVVCLPGLTRNSRDFRALAQHLTPDWWVVCPDLRGRGLSAHDPNHHNYVPATYVKDVIALLDELDIERAIFIGTSLGGIVSMAIVATNATRVAAVVLNDIGPEIDPAGLERIRTYVGKQTPVTNWNEAMAQARETHGATAPDLDHARWLDYARNVYREDADGIPQLDMDPKIGDASREAAPTPADPWALWQPMADVPTLVLRGETSDILSTATLQRMQEEKPDLMTATIPNRGHAPLLDEPASRRAIDQFLEMVGT